MNKDEQVVETFLKGLGLGAVAYEPDGNLPPDFVINGIIAVECRRLNLNYEKEGRILGHSTESITWRDSLTKLLSGFDGGFSGSSFFVSLILKKPMSRTKKTTAKQAIKRLLSEFLEHPCPIPTHRDVNENLSIFFFPTRPREGRVFLNGGLINRGEVGFVISGMLDNISLCSREKLAKIRPYRDKYTVWWLVLIDHIGYGLGKSDRAELQRLRAPEQNWDKIVIISPSGGKSNAYEI